MAIAAIDKIKINKYLSVCRIDDIYYRDLCNAVGKRSIELVDLIDFCSQSIVNLLTKDGKVTPGYINKLLYVADQTLCCIYEEKIEIGEELLDNVRCLQELYDNYLNRTNSSKDSSILEYLDTLVKHVNEFYPSNDNTNNESLVSYIAKVKELEDEIKSLKRKVVNSDKECNRLEAENNKLHDRVTALNGQIGTLNNTISQSKHESSSLNSTLNELKEKIESLEKSLNDVTLENETLLPFKTKCSELSSEVESLTSIVSKYEKDKNDSIMLGIKKDNIERILYQKLLIEDSSIDDIIRIVREKGIDTDSKEVKSILQGLRGKFNIGNGSFSLSPTYRVVSPTVMENGNFSINLSSNCKHYDILLVSDLHIRDVDEKILSGFDLINEYCVKHGINLILNLGDFFDRSGSLDYEHAILNRNLIDKVARNIPSCNGVYHAILGGNHDKNRRKYGIDPIGLLANERDDFINLGYIHSSVSLNQGDKSSCIFDIHHPETYDFPISLNDYNIDMDHLDNYFSKYCGSRAERDSYIDILGHTHRNQFNFPKSYCFVPAFFSGSTRLAYHLRTYFDEESNVKYMVFMPLSTNMTNSKFIKENEIIYQKVLTKDKH